MAARSRRALAIALLACAALPAAGCARDATGVTVTVAADATVPPLLILRTTMLRAGDSGQSSSSSQTSPYASDAADRPGPFVFPLDLSVTIDESYAGPVIVTIEGLDWDTKAVTARGSSAATVVARNTTRAALTLTAIPGTVYDGGVD